MKPQQDINKFTSTLEIKMYIDLQWNFYKVISKIGEIEKSKNLFDNIRNNLH